MEVAAPGVEVVVVDAAEGDPTCRAAGAGALFCLRWVLGSPNRRRFVGGPAAGRFGVGVEVGVDVLPEITKNIHTL